MRSAVERVKVQRFAIRQHETFGQEFFAKSTLICCQSQEFTKKRYIAVRKNANPWGCWGVAILPYVKNRNYSRMLWLS